MRSSLNNHNILFVTGTDTGVGKTVVSLMLMRHFFKMGKNPFYLKPFQTGCRSPLDRDSDAKFVYENVSELRKHDPSGSVIYCFPEPKAPLFAANADRKSIEMSFVHKTIREKAALHDPLIMEGAGGLYVPVTERILMVDLIEKLDPGVVLVARAGLGTINHTLLSIEALKNRGLKPAMIFLSDTGPEKTSQNMVQENIDAIKMFSGIYSIVHIENRIWRNSGAAVIFE